MTQDEADARQGGESGLPDDQEARTWWWSRPAREFTCPRCGSPLHPDSSRQENWFRCRMGHGYAGGRLLMDRWDDGHHAVLMAIRCFEEVAGLAARFDPVGPNEAARARYERLAMQRADLLRRVAYGRVGSPPAVAEILSRRGIGEEAVAALTRLSAADWAEIVMLGLRQWWEGTPEPNTGEPTT